MSMIPCFAEAAGLGKITVLSGLGQPLRAELEVGATREELSSMTVRLAPVDSFRQAGVDYTSGLNDLRFTLDKRPGGGSIVRVTSSRPINDPFLDFLVELNWSAGRLVREYTFLLDPPEVAAKSASKAVSVVEAKPVAALKGGQDSEPTSSAKPAAAEAPAKVEPKRETKPKAVESESKKPEGGATHVVQKGETLRKVAGDNQYEGVSLEQMLVGLYRANSDAFIGGNINRMKAGAILNLPDKEAVAAIPPAEAGKVYRAQAADWNNYRKKLAAAAAQGPARDDTGTQAAGGKITAKVEEKATPAETQKDQVKVSRTESAKAGAAGAGKAAAEENLLAKDKALKEAQERLVTLEKNIADLQKLVEMKNQSLAELQKQAAARKQEEVKPPVAAVKPAEPPKAPVQAPAETAKPAEAPKPVDTPKAEEPPKAAEVPKAAEAPKAAETPKPVEPAPEPVAKKPVPAPAPAPEPEEDLMDGPLPLVGGAGVLALLAGFFFMKRRRGQKKSTEFSSMVEPGQSSMEANSVFRSTGGQSVDTGNTTPQATDFSQTGPGTIDTDEVDPVAEADVYMAYGRDAQAEEILLEALQKDPQRLAIHVKLLEIYASRKSIKQFETLASELYAQTGGTGAEWSKVAALGARLDPSNPLFFGGMATAAGAEAFDADATVIISPADAAKGSVVNTDALSESAVGSEVADDKTAALPDLTPMPAFAEAAPAAAPEAEHTEEIDTGNVDLMSLDFDLGTANSGAADEEKTRPVEEPAAVDPLAGAEVGVLDFDLGTSPAEEPAVEMVPEPASEAAEVAPLDFDLNLGGAAATASEAPAIELTEAADLSIPENEAAIDVPQPGELVAEPAMDLDFDIGSAMLGEGGDAPALTDIAEESPSGQEEGVLDLSTLDASDVQFEVQLSDGAMLGEPAQEPAFDISSISLDLGAESQGGDVDLAAGQAESSSAGAPAASDPYWEEVNTKLDLAKAYEEMGDLEGARELLQEVIGEGPADLVEQAEHILERVSG